RLAIDLGEVSQRAAGADEAIAGREPPEADLRQAAPDVIAQAPELLAGRRIRIEELLAQSKRSERQADGIEHPAAPEPLPLQASPPEVDQRAAGHDKSPDGARNPEPRFRDTADDRDSNPELALDSPGEERAVVRVAHRSRRDGDDARRAGARRDRLKV